MHKQQREKEEKEIKQYYEAELAALNADDSESYPPKPSTQALSPILVLGSQKEKPIRLSSLPPSSPDCSLPVVLFGLVC